MNKKAIILLAIGGLLIGAAIAAAVTQFRLPTSGVFGDFGLTFNPANINWGHVNYTTTSTRQVNITNTGLRNFASLNMTVANPSAHLLNFTVAWDAEGLPLLVGRSVLANFTLTIYNYNATLGPNFTFDIYVQE